MGKGLPYSHSRGNPLTKDLNRMRISLDGAVITVTSTGAAIGFGTLVLADFIEGNIVVLGAVANIQFSGNGTDANLVDAWSGDFGVGTTPADDATITAGDVDLIPSTPLAAATSEVSPLTKGFLTTSLAFDGTDGTEEVNLNVLIDAVDIVDDQSVILTLSGYVELAYILLGDD